MSSTPKSTAAIAPRAVVVTFDRLHAGFLGCYGNDWIETPTFDRLATESVVFDQHFCENLDPAAANHAWWTGAPQFPFDEIQQRRCPSFIDELNSRSVRTCLMIESDGRGDMAVAPPFGEVLTAAGHDGFDVPEHETPFAQTVERCIERLQESAGQEGAELLWIKSSGVPVPWIPPQAFAELYLDEFGLSEDRDDDAEAVATEQDFGVDTATASPEDGPSVAGPDRSLDWRYATAMYAAYMTLLDRWLGRLLATLAATPGWEQPLLIVTTGAGQPLGENGALEDEMLPLRSESIQTPLWVRVPGSDQGGTRRQCLAQAVDLAPTLTEWLCGTGANAGFAIKRHAQSGSTSLLPWIRNETVTPREFVVLGKGREEWGIRTPNFYYVESGDRNPESGVFPARLFEKPHDRWDQSDVLSQYPQVAEDLRGILCRAINELTSRNPSIGN